jgi:flagellar biosynthesis protein FlhB
MWLILLSLSLYEVCLFICLFYSYIVSFLREDMQEVFKVVFHIICTRYKQENDDRSNFKSSKTISLVTVVICIRFIFVLIVSFLICIRFVPFVSSNDLCRLQNNQVFLSNNLKTIMFSQIELFEFFFTTEVFIPCSSRAHKSDTQQWPKVL